MYNPSPAPLTPAPLENPYWILIDETGSNKDSLGARALGARTQGLDRPRWTPGQFGLGLVGLG